MYRIHSRFDTGALCEWHECTGCESPMLPGEFESARAWISGFLVDDQREMNLRQLAHRSGDRLGLTLRSADSVVDEVARMIASGRLRVCQRQSVAVHDHPMMVGSLPPREATPPPPPVSRGRSAPVAPPPSEARTMPSNVNPAAMAGVLVQAAEEGTPFCEICEARRQQRADSQGMAA